MEFLMGLSDVYDPIRNQILLMDPLPSINKAYSMVIRVEKQKEVHIVFAPEVDSVMMVRNTGNKNHFKGSFKKQVNKDELYCDHCQMKRHTKETCFKLHGYPDWFTAEKSKKNDKFDKGRRVTGERNKMANMLESPMDFIDEGCVQYDDLQANIANRIQQGFERIMKGKRVVSSEPMNAVNCAHLEDFTGSGNSQVLAVGKAKAGLYILNSSSFSNKVIEAYLL
ncbi:hypothetical protein Syun_028488 [Stephania yunnanensis]|uniref:Uncharacterized protein n=1 Tax=Stephania yunnanensis TaxID=152371 RepID=A0AAP0EKV0_9MAGN